MLEKAGIPTVMIDLEDQRHMVTEWAQVMGVPNIRFLHAGRILQGPEEVENWIETLLEGLTEPLTDKEKESGTTEPPSQERIIFEGTLDEAQNFFQQTKHIPSPVDAPISVYSDGYPIIIPTEDRVKEMLTVPATNRMN